MKNSALLAIQKKALAYLSRHRFRHSLAVAREAERIALIFQVDPQKAFAAGLLHDIAKDLPNEKLITLAQKYRLPLNKIAKLNPGTLHSSVGAKLVEKEFKLRDRQILAAIRNHTFGRARMTKLEKIIYIADYIEDSRVFPGAKSVRQILETTKNLDRAVVAKAKAMLKYSRQKKWITHSSLAKLAKQTA